jgi:hypothetical protein
MTSPRSPEAHPAAIPFENTMTDIEGQPTADYL